MAALTLILGKNVKSYREKMGLSQEKLAEKIKVTKNTISDIETGKKFATAKTLEKLAAVFGFEVYELLKPEKVLPDNREATLYKFVEGMGTMLDKYQSDFFKKLK